MRFSLLFAILLLLAQFVFSQDAGTLFEQGNQLYKSGDYKKAAEMYEQIISSGYEDAALFYNLGNSYYKQKLYPQAILNYERAKELAPDDEEIEHNIRLSNLHVIDKIEPVPQLFLFEWWRAFVNMFPTDQWAWISVLLLWGAVLLGALLLILRSDIFRRIILLLGVLSFILCIISFVGMYQHSNFDSEQYAIIFSPSISVKSAPDTQSTDLFVLHEGVKAQILDEVGEWKKIKLADGKIGWMQATGLEVI